MDAGAWGAGAAWGAGCCRGRLCRRCLCISRLLISALVSAAVFLCGTLGLSEGNIVSLNVHAVVLDTVLVCIIAVAQTAFHNDHTALVEITADKLRLLSPAGNTNEISFPFAGLFVGKAPIHCHTDAADSDAALCLPEIRIRTKPSHQNHFIQHIVSLSEIGLTLR